MKISIQGFQTDSDTDFVLTPETEAERALVLGLRGREASVVFKTPNPDCKVYLRTQVNGART